MARLSIYVSTDLYEKLKKWEEVNFSKEFQHHIRRVIERREELAKRLDEPKIRTAVERLRQERRAKMPDMRKEGMNDGLDWASDASYDEIQAALDWDLGREGFPKDDSLEGLKDFFMTVFLDNPNLRMEDYQHDRVNSPSWDYLYGFKEGIEGFWYKIKDEI